MPIKIDGISPWKGICIRAEGICPLLVNWEHNRADRAAVGLIDLPDHRRTLEIDVYRRKSERPHRTFRIENFTGKARLQLAFDEDTVNKTMADKVISDLTTAPATAPDCKPRLYSIAKRVSDDEFSATYLPDVERDIYEQSLIKDYSYLAGALYFNAGEVFSYSIVKQPIVFQAEDCSFEKRYEAFADALGVKIEFEKIRAARLIVESPSQYIHSFDFLADPDDYFFMIKVQNLCQREVKEYEGDVTDFERYYQIFRLAGLPKVRAVLLASETQPLLSEYTAGGHQPGPLCTSIIAGRTKSF
jgi:hypothetical protein